MNVFSFSALVILFAAVWVAIFGYAEFFVLLLLSVFLINFMYGGCKLKETHQDKSTYKGWCWVVYPPFIFDVLMLTHPFWLGEFIKRPG